MRRIVLYGATGYMGGLTAHAMVASGARPVLAGRGKGRLDAVAARISQAVGGGRLRRPSPGGEGLGRRGGCLGLAAGLGWRRGGFFRVAPPAVAGAGGAG